MRIGFVGRRPPPGFTLLEVVVAMTIVGLGVVTLLEIFSMGLRLSARSSARTEATAYGRSVMDAYLLRSEMRDGEEQGHFGGQGRWTLDVRSLPNETDATSQSLWELKEITLHLPYSASGREKQIEMKTLRLARKERP